MAPQRLRSGTSALGPSAVVHLLWTKDEKRGKPCLTIKLLVKVICSLQSITWAELHTPKRFILAETNEALCSAVHSTGESQQLSAFNNNEQRSQQIYGGHKFMIRFESSCAFSYMPWIGKLQVIIKCFAQKNIMGQIEVNPNGSPERVSWSRVGGSWASGYWTDPVFQSIQVISRVQQAPVQLLQSGVLTMNPA